MPIQITRDVARLLTPEGREAALTETGVPTPIATLVEFLSPDPTTPYAFGALKRIDLPMRRAAVLARARMNETLSKLGLPDPDLLWEFLARHPRTVEVWSVPHSFPRPPELPRRVVKETRFPERAFSSEPVQVTISRRAPDRPGGIGA